MAMRATTEGNDVVARDTTNPGQWPAATFLIHSVRAFGVAVDDELLAVRPVFRLPALRNARSGFFEDGDFAALLLELPAHIRPVVQFLRMTGWRKSEALGLTWDQVDWEGQVMRLYATQTKGGDARVFPFGDAPELLDLAVSERPAER